MGSFTSSRTTVHAKIESNLDKTKIRDDEEVESLEVVDSKEDANNY